MEATPTTPPTNNVDDIISFLEKSSSETEKWAKVASDNGFVIEDVIKAVKRMKKRTTKSPKTKFTKLTRVRQFYERHISGLNWMRDRVVEIKGDSPLKGALEEMVKVEEAVKKQIEDNAVLKIHL